MSMHSVSIGYRREDGDFRILATFNNVDDELTPGDFLSIVNATAQQLQTAAGYVDDLPPLEILNRQDTPDYVSLDETEA